jgi:hypothetical protein
MKNINVMMFVFLKTIFIQRDFAGCADILTCDRTPRKVTTQPIMPYTNVDIFLEKRAKSFSKKV